ncbi:ribonuclease T [Gilliamella sp. B3781]|nr:MULTISPECIES: ribonuclease T [unclassified Gilliamella]MCX8642253.1 ribonuclease T [Gilliamella sp. B3835]MCX8707651.1 ribonuclease T [Gilliamella sp. B3783]MCX8710022.1 ribonuclease T [Gilliamella sp. B3780]MCX8712819.1 ribonuclease T [Gilliamella sp. B3468]MCX8713490.1 ribonuclease T [Gilliamella sp. B3781]
MPNTKLCERFRGFYPVVIDIETSGFDPKLNAILEIAAITLKMNDDGWLEPDETLQFNVNPFENSILEPSALAFNGIDPDNPLRAAVDEKLALESIFKMVRTGIKAADCTRAVIVAHNAHFDHSFLMAAAERAGIKRNPFHPFATFDTASLCGLVFGQTVLAKACEAANIAFDHKQAHSALYDTEKTAILFCEIVNRFKRLGGWPLPQTNEQPDQSA